MQLRRTPPPHAPPHSPTPGGGDLGHPGGASALEEGLHLGLSWELGRWPMGHLWLQSTTRTGATKPRSPVPLCPPRPGPCSARLSAGLTALCTARIASGPRALRLGAVSPACPTAHFSPTLSGPPRPSLLTLFSGLITFRIKAKPSPGCEYNALRASRGEERGAETSRGQQRGWQGGEEGVGGM